MYCIYILVFIPVVLENLAGKAGYELDQVTPCNTVGYLVTFIHQLVIRLIMIVFT